jgi:hypothetical protein
MMDRLNPARFWRLMGTASCSSLGGAPRVGGRRKGCRRRRMQGDGE